MRYADGRLAVIRNSRRAVYGYDQRVELLGSEGLLSADNVLENTVSKATTAGVTSAKPEFFFLERYMRAYAAEWTAFVEAVVANSPGARHARGWDQRARSCGSGYRIREDRKACGRFALGRRAIR